VIGIGPRIESSGAGMGGHRGGGGGFHGGPEGLSGGGLSGSRGGMGPMNASVARKYSLTFSAWSTNILNHENLGTPNGTLSSKGFFGTSQTLAGGFFASPTAGNRNLTLQASFSF